jgi:predicted N-acetyltransferase YhbS
MPDEVILLKCYDSLQGKDGSALYCGHVAVQVDGDDEGIAQELVKPRESIEVRLVVWCRM